MGNSIINKIPIQYCNDERLFRFGISAYGNERMVPFTSSSPISSVIISDTIVLYLDLDSNPIFLVVSSSICCFILFNIEYSEIEDRIIKKEYKIFDDETYTTSFYCKKIERNIRVSGTRQEIVFFHSTLGGIN